jgi:polar amino acid transport system ATP-binding protein
MEPVIKLERIKKSFNGRLVLDKLDLVVKKNEIVTLIGQSGVGKTTLLRTIAGLETPDSGNVAVQGVVGMVFQHCYLWPHKTVLENVLEPLIKVKKMDLRTAEAKAIEVLTKLGLAHRIKEFPDTLSGGETQRVAIARTLAMDPEILLLDEITSALDPVLVKEVIDTIRSLAREKRTIILVTHEMEFAKEISDRIVFLDSGEVLEEGNPYKLFTNPEHERTRLFVNLTTKR